MIIYALAAMAGLAALFVFGSLVGLRLKRISAEYPTVGGDEE